MRKSIRHPRYDSNRLNYWIGLFLVSNRTDHENKFPFLCVSTLLIRFDAVYL